MIRGEGSGRRGKGEEVKEFAILKRPVMVSSFFFEKKKLYSYLRYLLVEGRKGGKEGADL